MNASDRHPTPPDVLVSPAGSNAASKSSANARLPIERVLPASVASQLERAAAPSRESLAALTTRLDRELNITRQYGITRRRLLYYLKRLRAKHGAADKSLPETATSASGCDAEQEQPGAPSPTPDESESSERGCAEDEARSDFRKRQESVAQIIHGMFGPLAKCKPELWGRRAYLMLVGLVYEKLATNEKVISTDELIALGKVLAANKRADARAGEAKQDGQDSTPRPADGQLPKNFDDIVRQVYGTNFQEPSDGAEE